MQAVGAMPPSFPVTQGQQQKGRLAALPTRVREDAVQSGLTETRPLETEGGAGPGPRVTSQAVL